MLVDVLNVPLVKIKTLLVVKAPPNVHAPPTPLNVGLNAQDTPLVVTVSPVYVPAKVTVPEYVADTPPLVAVPLNVKLPYTLMAVEPAHVTWPVVGPDMFMLKQAALVPIVTVYAVALLAVSKYTSSAEVGGP